LKIRASKSILARLKTTIEVKIWVLSCAIFDDIRSSWDSTASNPRVHQDPQQPYSPSGRTRSIYPHPTRFQRFIKMNAQKTRSFSSGMNGQSLGRSVLKALGTFPCRRKSMNIAMP